MFPRYAVFKKLIDSWINTCVFAQSAPSPSDGAYNTSSTLLPSPICAPPSPSPGQHIETSTGNAISIHSDTAGHLPKYDPDFDSPTPQGDLACKAFSSRDSLNCSVIDGFPSSASVNLIPSIPSLALDLHLQNFPASDEQPLEPHSIYFSAVEGDLSMSRRSEDGPVPGHETGTSCGSASELCFPTAEEAHHQIPWQENPSPRRQTARIEVQSDAFRLDRQGRVRRESFTYACKALPYDAGLRPHAYVDNREYTIHGKNHLEALAEDLYAMEEFMEEDHITGESKRPTVFRKLVERKRISKLVTLGPIKFRKISKRYSVHSRATEPQSPTASSSVENFVDRNPVTANSPNNPNCPPPLPPSSPPPPSHIPNKKRPRALSRMTWPGPRPLSMFLIPKPTVEGKVIPSPKELPIYLPASENPPPLSPPTSPQARSAQLPETDVHGRPYGPSRISTPDPSPKSPDPLILGRKERWSWLGGLRSPKSSLLVT